MSDTIARIAVRRPKGRTDGVRRIGCRSCDRLRRLTYSPHSVQILVFESAAFTLLIP